MPRRFVQRNTTGQNKVLSTRVFYMIESIVQGIGGALKGLIKTAIKKIKINMFNTYTTYNVSTMIVVPDKETANFLEEAIKRRTAEKCQSEQITTDCPVVSVQAATEGEQTP